MGDLAKCFGRGLGFGKKNLPGDGGSGATFIKKKLPKNAIFIQVAGIRPNFGPRVPNPHPCQGGA